jgi:hypothetical protein
MTGDGRHKALLRIGVERRLGYLALGCREVTMVDLVRRARLIREMEEDFVPDYDAVSLPSADKRAAYALEHIAFRVGRIEQTLAKLAVVIEAALVEPKS